MRPEDKPATTAGSSRAVGLPAGAPPYVPLLERLKSADEVNKEWETLTLYRNMAIPAAGGILVLGNVINLYSGGFTATPFSYYLLGQLLVRVALIILVLLWIQSGTVEYGYLTRWIRTPTLRSRRPVQVMLSFFILAAFFGLLMAVSDRLHLLLLLYCLYLLVDIATWKLRRDEIGAALDSGERFLSTAVPKESGPNISSEIERDRAIASIHLRALEALRRFYFCRYQITRIVVTLGAMTLLCIAAYVVPRAAVGLVHVDPSGAKLNFIGFDLTLDGLRFVAYLLFILVLLASEVVMSSWRSELRVALYDVRDALANFQAEWIAPVRPG